MRLIKELSNNTDRDDIIGVLKLFVLITLVAMMVSLILGVLVIKTGV